MLEWNNAFFLVLPLTTPQKTADKLEYVYIS